MIVVSALIGALAKEIVGWLLSTVKGLVLIPTVYGKFKEFYKGPDGGILANFLNLIFFVGNRGGEGSLGALDMALEIRWNRLYCRFHQYVEGISNRQRCYACLVDRGRGGGGQPPLLPSQHREMVPLRLTGR